MVEAKSIEVSVREGVAQAKNYAEKLQIAYAYSCNGKEIYQMDMQSGRGMLVTDFTQLS